MDIIKALQENEKAFGLMSEEMQEKAGEIGRPQFLVFDGNEWLTCVGGDRGFTYDNTYRLRADYQEDEYEESTIFEEDDMLRFTYKDHHHVILDVAPAIPSFAGYLYEDGVLEGNSVRYFHGNVETSSVNFDDIKSGDATILRPTHVVFRKG